MMSPIGFSGCKYERFWARRIARLKPISIDYSLLGSLVSRTGGVRKRKFAIPENIKALHEVVPRSDALVAAFSAYLSRLVNISFFDIGYTDTSLQRSVEGLKEGFVNYVPFHIDLDSEQSFKGFCKSIREELRRISEYGRHLQDVLVRQPSLRPAYDDFEKTVSVGVGLVERLEDVEALIVKEVTLGIPKYGSECLVLYDSSAQDEESINKFLEYLAVFVRGIISNPSLQMLEQPLLNEKGRKQLLYEFNDTMTEVPEEKVLQELFEEQVEKSPNNLAVVFKDRKVTYRELNQYSNQLARTLRERGVKREEIVGLMVDDNSVEMIIGMIAILKAGGAYLPIDPEYPKDRIKYMLEDSNIAVLLTQTNFDNQMLQFEGKVIKLDNKSIFSGESFNLEKRNQANDLAYVIYTSGSTGKPKGVEIEHRSIVNQLFGLQKRYLFDTSLNHILLAPITFDPSVQQIFLPLISGGKLFLVPKTTMKNVMELLEVIVSNRIDIIDTVPSLMSILLDNIDSRDNLHFKYIILAGERFPKALYERLKETVSAEKVINIYGPTEATINTTLYECKRKETNTTIPIGKPLMNYNVLILDQGHNLCPMGVAGEICISGVGLARGYVNRPELTADKFVSNPFIRGQKMYCSGDLGRWNVDGNIEFLGRMDDQVKIRGCRVELEEIEVALRQHPAVRDNLVIIRENDPDDKVLVAYCVLNQIETPPVSELRRFLGERVPGYMIPSEFIFLDKFPLTDNGKVDRRALPKPDCRRRNLEEDFVAPQTPIEEELARIWAKALGLERVGVYDNFFDLGGTSLIALSLFAQIEKRFGKRLPLAALFPTPTIRKLANTLREGNKHNSGYSLVPLQPNGYNPPLFGIHSTRYHTLARYLGPEQPIYALRYGHGAESSEDVQSLPDRIEDLVLKYIEEMKTVQPEGPYYLIGLCIGALVAFEMAHQLTERGEQVAMLALADPIIQSGLTPLPFRTKVSNMLQLGPVETLTRVQEKAIKKIRMLKRKNGNRAQDKYLTYIPQKVYPGKAIIFKSVGGLSLSSTFDPELGWGKLVGGGLEIHEIRSGHTELFDEPPVRVVGQILKNCLDQARVDVFARSKVSDIGRRMA